MSTNKTAIFGLVATLVGTGLGSLAGFNQLMNPANSSDSGFPVAIFPTPSPSPTISPNPVASGWLTQRSSDSPTQSVLPIQDSPRNQDRYETDDRPNAPDTTLTQADSERFGTPDRVATRIPDRAWSDAPVPRRDRHWQQPRPRPSQPDRGERTLSSLPDPTSPRGRYSCSDITKAEAQALVEQGHTYLDPDRDGQACEQGTWGYPTPVTYGQPTWQPQEASSQPDADWRYTRRDR